MNSPTLVALLIFCSAPRVSSFLEYSESDSNESVDITAKDSSSMDYQYLGSAEENEIKRRNSLDASPTLEGILSETNEQPAQPEWIEVPAEKHLLDYFQNFVKVNENQEVKPSQLPQRREVKHWKSSNDHSNANIPFFLDSLPKGTRNEYAVDPNYLENKEPDNPSLILSGEHIDPNSNAKLSQYLQKNYYYNYYPLFSEKKTPAPKWNVNVKYNPEDSKKRINNVAPKTLIKKNPCRHYLEFLNYAFDKLDENLDYMYSSNEDYLENWRERDPSIGHRVFGTHLLGPTFYIDNSGKILQMSTNGNGVQIAEGISPDSRISVASNSLSTPNNVLTTLDYPTTTPTFKAENSSNYDLNQSRVNKDSMMSGKNDAGFQTRPPLDRNPATLLNDINEYTTAEDSDYDSGEIKGSKDEFFSRMGDDGQSLLDNTLGNEITTSSFPYWFIQNTTQPPATILNYPSRGNKVRVQTVLSIEGSSENDDADCNDKMLPCPDTVNITYPLNGYCNRYVSCELGKAIRRTCPDGLHFNIIIKSCDLPHNSFCTYSCPQPNGIFGVPGDCGGYFICKNYNPEYRMCPPKMHWDVSRNTCIFAELSSCSMKCFKDNEVRHYEGDCAAYVVCLNGMPFYHRCPPNMKFDRKNLVCVPERMLNCEDDPKLLTKTLNPSTVCKDAQLKMHTSAWCRSFMPSNISD